MTENEFLAQLMADYEATWAELDVFVRSASDEAWSEVRDDNGWTTAQIVEHLMVSVECYGPVLEAALGEAKPSDGSAPVKHSFIGNFLIKAISGPSAPAPKKLLVERPISAEVGLRRWGQLDRFTRTIFEKSHGKSLSSPKFRNPIVPLFKMNTADTLSLWVVHLKYHAPQLKRRLSV